MKVTVVFDIDRAWLNKTDSNQFKNKKKLYQAVPKNLMFVAVAHAVFAGNSQAVQYPRLSNLYAVT